MSEACHRLRALLDAAEAVAAPGVGDPLGARLVERAGFRVVYLGGNALGTALARGQPLVDLSDTVRAASRIVATTGLPLIVDAGAGFGAPAHVHRAVRDIEATGAAGLHIDDQSYPKSPGYHRGRAQLAAPEEAAARIAVACEARRSDDFLIFARTDAFRVTGSIGATAERCAAYAAAGADGLVLLDVEDAGDVAAIAEAVPGCPLIWIGGVRAPVPGPAELGLRGFALALYPFSLVAAAVDAMERLLDSLARTGTVDHDAAFLARMRHELALISGMETYWSIEDRQGAAAAPGPRQGHATR